RAVALGADAAFAGKAFLWGLGALGPEGPAHVIDLMIDEMKSAVGQLGARRLNDLRSLVIRHGGAMPFDLPGGQNGPPSKHPYHHSTNVEARPSPHARTDRRLRSERHA